MIKRAFRDFRSNIGIQLGTCFVIALSVLVVGFFATLYVNFLNITEQLGTRLGIVVYMKSVSDNQIPQIYQRLSKLDGVMSVKYIPPKKALEQLKDYFKDEPQILDGIKPSVFPPSFEIKVKQALLNPENLAKIAKKISKWPSVEKVQYGRGWVKSFNGISKILKILAFILAVIVLLAMAFVVANTIKLTLYSRRSEIEILRLVGATSSFIQIPFILESLAQALVGSLIAFIIIYAGSLYFRNLIIHNPILSSIGFIFLPMSYALIITAITVLVCLITTLFSVNKALNL